MERMSDSKREVRLAALPLLVTMAEVFKPQFVLEAATKYWSDKNWRMKHGLLQTVAELLCVMGPACMAVRGVEQLLHRPIFKLMEDSNP